jgi:hypothetical protein
MNFSSSLAECAAEKGSVYPSLSGWLVASASAFAEHFNFKYWRKDAPALKRFWKL